MIRLPARFAIMSRCRSPRALLVAGSFSIAAGIAGAADDDPSARSTDAAAPPARIEAGRAIAHDWYRGNCLACHQVPGDPTAETLADIGPPIVAMRERFPDRSALRAQLWDPTERNPLSYMPPFGKHGVLTGEEIDLVLDYIYQY